MKTRKQKPRAFTALISRIEYISHLRGNATPGLFYDGFIDIPDGFIRVRVTPLPARKKRRSTK